MPTRPFPPTDAGREPEEDELDVPPLDADTNDDLPREEEPDLPLVIDEGGLDDSTATDLDIGDDVAPLDGDGVDDGDGEVDVGRLEDGIDVDEREAGGPEDEGAPDMDVVVVDEATDADDGGIEGTGENPEDEVDERALPDLDDGEAEGGDGALARELLVADVGALPPWAAVRFSPLEGAGAAVPCRTVRVAAGRVAAAGEVLLFVEEGARAARRLPFGDGVIAVALTDDALLAATARGQLLASEDVPHGKIDALGAFRSAGGAMPVELAATPGRFWIRAGTSLASVAPRVGPPTVVRERGVSRIAAAAGALVAITAGPAGPAIERFRGDDEEPSAVPLAGLSRSLVEAARDGLLLAATAAGRCLALGDGAALVLSRDGGLTFSALDLGPVTALAFAGDRPDAPLLALVAPVASPSAFLVEVGASGETARIAELTAAEREPPVALAWDPAREIVWVASGAGLIALGRPRRH